jgi:hypothetical protein
MVLLAFEAVLGFHGRWVGVLFGLRGAAAAAAVLSWAGLCRKSLAACKTVTCLSLRRAHWCFAVIHVLSPFCRERYIFFYLHLVCCAVL